MPEDPDITVEKGARACERLKELPWSVISTELGDFHEYTPMLGRSL
jgi:hypothetical protein